MRGMPRGGKITIALGVVVAVAIIAAPALGGPSLRSLVKKEVAKQISKATGPQGPPGPPGTAAAAPGATLPQGATLRGVFHAVDTHPTTGASKTAGEGVSYDGYRLSARPAANLVPVGGGPTTNCPGTLAAPEAASGELCVYIGDQAADTLRVIDPVGGVSGLSYMVATMTTTTTGTGKVSTMGFMFDADNGSGNVAYVRGTWAVTG